MSNKLRNIIVNNAKKNIQWCNNETTQDKIIEQECINKKFTLQEFYATNGKYLNKLFGNVK